MKKELCVTTKPWITSYSYYALPQCIIQAEDKIGKIVATFQIAESASNDWSKIGNWKQERSQWYLLDETAFGLDCNACLYREVSREKDFIHIKIEKQRYSGPWGAVNLFLTDNKEDILLGDNEYLCRFGSFVYDGLHLYKEGKEQKIQTAYNGKFPCSFSFDVDIPYELVLSRRGNVAEVYGGTDKLDLLSRTDLPVAQEEKWYIGIQVKHENNTFYPWFYSNFIALSCDVTCTHRRLDYLSLTKHWDFNLYNYFLDINYFSVEEILELGGIKYVKRCIDGHKYLELKVDQYYLKEREEYHTEHHLHQNLIYGYDDREKSFLLIGYQNTGKLMKCLLPYKDLEKSLNTHKRERIKVIHYAEDGHGYPFQPEYVKRMFLEYLNSVNSSISIEFLLPQDNRKYGLDIYDELASERGLEVLLSDRRISYLLWEHKYHMRGRIEYLAVQGVFKEVEMEDLRKRVTELIDISFNLRSVVQKYQMRPDKTDKNLLRTWLSELKEKEKKLLEDMLKLWQKTEPDAD